MVSRIVLSTLATASLLCTTAPRSACAQGFDIEKGLKIYQAVKEIQDADKDKQKRKKEEEKERSREQERSRERERAADARSNSNSNTNTNSTASRGGADGLRRRVVGSWEYQSRRGRTVLARVFGDDGRYVFQENGSITERGRWQSEADALVLRPDNGSPARLMVSRVDRSSMEAQYEIDAENDAQPTTWRRVTANSNNDDESYDDRPVGGSGRPGNQAAYGRGEFDVSQLQRPTPDNSLIDGYYRSANNVTIEVRDGFVRIVENSRSAPEWLEPEQLSVRNNGPNRVRFTHQGLEQIGVKTPARR